MSTDWLAGLVAQASQIQAILDSQSGLPESIRNNLLEGCSVKDGAVTEWHNTILAHGNENQTLKTDAHTMVKRLNTTAAHAVLAASKALVDREPLLFSAFEAFTVLVEELLKVPHARDSIGTENVPSLPIVIDRFKALGTFCEALVDAETLEAVECMQEIGETGQLLGRVRDWKARMSSDHDGLKSAVDRGEQYFNAEHGKHENARTELRRAEERRDDFLYKVFGDSDIDCAVDNCRNAEDTAHRIADDAWNAWDQLRRLRDSLWDLLHSVAEDIYHSLDQLTDNMIEEYKKVTVGREIDKSCWTAVRTLQYHVETNTEYTARNDALRHALKLVDTHTELLDSNATVVGLRQRVLDRVVEVLGTDKAERLRNEQKFLETPEDLDDLDI